MPAPVIKTEAQLRWEEAEGRALERLKRNDLKLTVKEIDFTDITEVDEINYLDVKPNPVLVTDTKSSEGQRRFGLQMTIPPPCPPPAPPGGMPPPPLLMGMPAPPGLPPPHTPLQSG